MRIFKFGGASINSVERIQNLATILQTTDTKDLVLIMSAMGKTTNKMEEIVKNYTTGKEYLPLIANLETEYIEVAKKLFSKNDSILYGLVQKFDEIRTFFNYNLQDSYNYIYDQIVPYGELITTYMISLYLNTQRLPNTLLDARDYISTDNTFRDASVNWEQTEKNIRRVQNKGRFFITQGFIGSDKERNTTTLGREGSDYTAAIFAYCLDALELNIWKDVDGVLNADPRYFSNPVLLEHVSFREAIELAYYGASIIHPKTIQPLYSKGIPLRVRSFLDIDKTGTVVSEGKDLIPDVPCYILKKAQHLLNISSRDFSFIVENDISLVFSILHKYQMKVNLLHNSAISLSLCVDDRLGDIDACIKALQEDYNVKHTSRATLYTIRNYDEKDFEKRFGAVNPLLKQTKDDVVHIILDEATA